MRLLSVLSLVLLSLALLPGKSASAQQLLWFPDGNPGGDGVWSLNAANWNDGTEQVAFVNGRGARFGSPAGTVTLEGSLEAEEVVFSVPGYRLELDFAEGDGLSLQGISGEAFFSFGGLISAGADSYPGLAALQGKGLILNPTEDLTFTSEIATLNGGSPHLAVVGEAGRVDFAGRWLADTGSIISWLRLEEGGHFRIKSEADMRFIKTGFFTLQLWVTGDGSGTLELEEGFVADQTENGTVRDGIGSIRMGAGTLVTHHSGNLPLGYRPRADGTSQANGHLVFENQSGLRWEVLSNDQAYPGAIWIHKGVEIHTEADFTHIGVTESSSNYTAQNGFSVLSSATVRKTGPGTLTLAGEQSYAPGAILQVDEGILSLQSDPAAGQSLYGAVTGAQLGLSIATGGRVEWQTDGSIQTLTSTGELFLGGPLRIRNGGIVQLGNDSLTELLISGSITGPLIDSEGPVFVGGDLDVSRIPHEMPTAGTEWVICEAPSITGEWNLIDHTGMELSLVNEGTVLKLVAGKAPAGVPGTVLLEDEFDAPDPRWDDLSLVPQWGSPRDYSTAFEWTESRVRLVRSGSRSTLGYTSYSNSIGLKTFQALDFQFPESLQHAESELTIDYRMRWPSPGDAIGEGGRVLLVLNHAYPEGGLDLTREGEAGSRVRDFSGEWWARPAYHVRMRNSTSRSGSSMLQYGGGATAEGEYERTAWWLPGFISGAGSLAPGAGDDFPENSWVRTREGMARAAFTTFRYRVLPDRQELWRDDNDDGYLTDDELKAVMPLPTASDAPLYQYFTTFEGFRIFWNGVDDSGSGDTGQAEFDWIRIVHQDNLSPVAEAGPEVFTEVLSGDRSAVPLDASGSTDPEGAGLMYLWYHDEELLLATADPVSHIILTPGTRTLDLVVLDPAGNTAFDSVVITVTEGPARPVADAGADQSVIAVNEWYGLVPLSAAGSFSPNGALVRYEWESSVTGGFLYSGPEPAVTVALPIGVHQLTLRVWDMEMLFTEDTVKVIVESQASGQLSTLYRENFSRPDNGVEMGPWEVGWNLMRYDGDPVASVKYDGNAHRSLSTGDAEPPYFTKVNADPNGSEYDYDRAQGHMWMNQMPNLNSGNEWMLWTEEFVLDRTAWDLNTITFHATDSSPERVKVSPAMRIGGQWYLGWDLRVETWGSWWRSYTMPLALTGWYLFEPSSTFTIKDATPVDLLPEGNIEAFGFYFFKDYAWYVNQIDNFAVQVTPARTENPYRDWLFQNYSQAELIAEAESGRLNPEEDFNGDGWANVWDYATGRTDGATPRLLYLIDGEPRLVIDWNPAAVNLELDVFQSTDLAQWVNIEELVDVPVLSLPYTDHTGENWYRNWSPLPDSDIPVFYRIEIRFAE